MKAGEAWVRASFPESKRMRTQRARTVLIVCIDGKTAFHVDEAGKLTILPQVAAPEATGWVKL